MDVIQQSSAFQSPIVRLEAKHRRTKGERDSQKTPSDSQDIQFAVCTGFRILPAV